MFNILNRLQFVIQFVIALLRVSRVITYFFCLESTESTKKIPNPEELLNISSKFMNDVRQDIHFIRNPEIHPEIQATFLSESVQKYLELGRSIPGAYRNLRIS